MSKKQDKNKESQVERRPDGTLKPGHTANPNGLPKGTAGMTEKMRMYLAKRIDATDPNSKSRMEALVEAISDNAVGGDTRAQKMIWEQLEGRPTQKTDITTDGKPVNFITPQEIADKNNVEPSRNTKESS